MSSIPQQRDEDDDASDEFLRQVARVEERPPPSVTVPFEGSKLGQFKVLTEIGRGGMGIVFLAEDEKLRRKVALKVLKPSFASDTERRRRFLREARAAAAVSHPNLVTIFDAGEHEGRAYLAMEYLRGQSLRQVLSERSLGVDEAIELARQALAGLVHAHAAGLLHRDLKPENVLVGRDGRVRLLDFGLAKLIADVETSGEHSTNDGRILGTPGYMSPEQARGQVVDARSDVFSFGTMFFEMLTRRRPFTGASSADVITSLLRDAPPRADELRPEIGAALADIIARCLEKAPDDRYPSAAALADALDDAGTSAKRARTAPTSAAATTARSRRRRRAGVIAGAIAFAALAGGALVVTKVRRAAEAADAVVAPRPLAITDLPPPPSSSPDALAAYHQGLQAMRDADWAIAEERFKEALTHDSALSAAHLRLAIITSGNHEGPSLARGMLGRAMATRASLSERDRALLFAMEPLINRDPAERALASSRLRELANANPLDAEAWHLFATFGVEGTDEGIAASRHAVELDPQFADAWQILARQLANNGLIDEAHAAIDRCIAISPLSADCRGERAHLYSEMGECAKMEEDLRRGLSSNPRAASTWHEDRAAALLAVGRSDETVLEAFRQKWSVYSDERRNGAEPYDRALLAAVRGRLAEADALLVEGEKAIDLDPNAQLHARYAHLRIAIARETGRTKDAATIARNYITRKDVWIGSADSEIPMLRVMKQGKLISADDFAKRRDAWYDHARATEPDFPVVFWMLAYAENIDTPDEAKEALALLPPYTDRGKRQFILRAKMGHAYLLAGNAKEAVPLLEHATRACNSLQWPVASAQALLDLGQAREQTEDKAGACEAYQRVVSRWGAAQRSKTATVAKERLKILACSSEPAAVVVPPPVRSWSGPPNAPFEEIDDDDEREVIIAPNGPAPPFKMRPPKVHITPPVVHVEPPVVHVEPPVITPMPPEPPEPPKQPRRSQPPKPARSQP